MSRRVVDKTRPPAGSTAEVRASGTQTASAQLEAPVGELVLSRDGKRVYALQSYEISVLNSQTLDLIRTIEVPNERPSLAEAGDGELWIGGHHLYRCPALSGRAQKVGTRMNGWVDRIAFVRPDLLAGMGSNGEALWSSATDTFEHQRAASHTELAGPVILPSQVAAFADGMSNAWLLDPARPQGYTQVRFKRTSVTQEPGEAIVALHADQHGRLVLAAFDGGVAMTTERLTLAREFFPRAIHQSRQRQAWEPAALALANDERWIYVLRPGGELQRFLISQPPRPKEVAPVRGVAPRPQVIDPLPPAQFAVLPQPADTLVLLPGASGDEYTCEGILAGRSRDGNLGIIWRTCLEALPWQPLSLRERTTVDVVPPAAPPVPPSFVTLRSKPKGVALKALAVDDVLAADGPIWICAHQGPLLDRPTQALTGEASALPGDPLILPAMLRPAHGLARPALVLWPASPDDERNAEEPLIFAWGDAPRGWLHLNTQQLREQRWARTDVFPCEVVLRTVPPHPPGKRRPLAPSWKVDREAFAALANECKRQLKVLW